ncbi:acyl-CoA dehydrogenase [Mycobacterium sp. CBMA226]|nr:acyl-CoA dehydrogenase [Mycolicibacterium sp. CBMA 226]
MEFTEEHDELRKTVRRFLAARSGESDIRNAMHTDKGYDPVTWNQIAELGLTGLAVPEEFGGAGCGWTEVGIVLEETGRALTCAPYFSTVVLATAALLASEDQTSCKELLPGIADGSTTATLAASDYAPAPGLDGGTLTTERIDGQWVLHGTKAQVLDGHTASLILVAAHSPSGTSMFAVDGNAPQLTSSPLQMLDMTRKYANLEFRGVPARLIGAEGAGDRIVRRAINVGLAALSVEQLGGAEQCMAIAVEYAKARYQFGRPIGSFQAVQHLCADMLVEVETARSAAYHAIWAADHDPDEIELAAPMAKVNNADSYFAVAGSMMQVLGGVGFTWEHPAHLHLKRAKSGQHFLGGSLRHRAELAKRIGI